MDYISIEVFFEFQKMVFFEHYNCLHNSEFHINHFYPSKEPKMVDQIDHDPKVYF